MIKEVYIQIEGMSCSGCKAKIEAEVGALKGVQSVRVDHTTGEGVVSFDGGQVGLKRIFKTIEMAGYRARRSPQSIVVHSRTTQHLHWLVAAGLVVAFAAVYMALQRLGFLQVLAQLNERNLSYGLIFGIGLLASFHCVGMCGGLVVTYTARQQAQGNESRTGVSAHVQYNLGRVSSYTLTGLILGSVGSFFAISPAFTGVVTLLAAIFMVIMGLSLLTEFRFLKRLELVMPSFVGRFLYGPKGSSSSRGPLMIGLLNGLMPCGPLQAMQLYALASGSPVRGALSMAAYGLGTVPMMFGLGNLVSVLTAERTRVALRVSGVIVLVLGVLMFNRGLDSLGVDLDLPTAVQPVVQPIVSKASTVNVVQTATPATDTVQVVHMKLTRRGYEPNVLRAKVSVPVRWVIDVVEMSSCTNRLIMPEYGVDKKFVIGENVIEFTPTKTGELPFSCWMQMVWGKFVIDA